MINSSSWPLLRSPSCPKHKISTHSPPCMNKKWHFTSFINITSPTTNSMIGSTPRYISDPPLESQDKKIIDQICCSGIQHKVWWDVHRRTRRCQGRFQTNICIIHLPQAEQQITQQIEDLSSERLHNRWWPHAQKKSEDTTSVGWVHH